MELARAKTATRWAAAALTCAIVADLAEDLIDPANSGSATKVYAAASLHHGRLIASAFLVLATAVFIVPGVFGLVRLVDDRGRRFGRLAATLALLGALGHAALAAVYLVWAAIPSSGMSRTDLVELIDRINGSGWLAAFAPLFFAFPLSLVALFVALSRARVAPTWNPGADAGRAGCRDRGPIPRNGVDCGSACPPAGRAGRRGVADLRTTSVRASSTLESRTLGRRLTSTNRKEK